MLPDDILLAIFDFCADENEIRKEEIEAWHTLVHVCHRWRTTVFGSPRRLNLQLVCSAKTPARDTLDVWPALPLVIRCFSGLGIEKVDDVVAVLEHSNRVRQIGLILVSSPDLEKISAAMQVPFPELTRLHLRSNKETVPALRNSFLGGSAPCLRYISLHGIPFPGLPKLLLSATHLVDLCLFDIPHSGYFSPVAIVTALSTLTSLRELLLQFQSPRSRPDKANRRPPPPTHFILPLLTRFSFKGVGEYLEDFVARIDAPRLKNLVINFFNQIIFDTPQLIQFISRTRKFKALEKAGVTFEDGAACVNLTSKTSRHRGLSVRILCRELDWQVSSLEQVCTFCLPPLSMLEDLYISEVPYWQSDWQDNVENTLWLELLRPFTAVKSFYLSEEFARRIVPSLQELIGVRTTEVLPAVESIFLEGLQPSGPVQEGIGLFVATRQVIGRHIEISRWERA